MHVSQNLQNSSSCLPSSFDEDYTSTEGEGDVIRKAQFVVELQPKTQVKGWPWNDVGRRQPGAMLEHVRLVVLCLGTLG